VGTMTCGLVLNGCIGTTALSKLGLVRPLGDPFSQALYSNYAFLARSFGDVGMPRSGTPFDVEQSIQLGSGRLDIADVANAFAQKALAAASGDSVLPEPAADDLKDSSTLRLQLLRDLDNGRDKSPVHAARAQADYDCWIINARTDALVKASGQCRQSLTASLALLERDLAPGPTPATSQPDVSQPAAPAAPTPGQPGTNP